MKMIMRMGMKIIAMMTMMMMMIMAGVVTVMNMTSLCMLTVAFPD